MKASPIQSQIYSATPTPDALRTTMIQELGRLYLNKIGSPRYSKSSLLRSLSASQSPIAEHDKRSSQSSRNGSVTVSEIFRLIRREILCLERLLLSIARFTQEMGAASSFHKVVETLETVLKCRGMLVADDRKRRMMIKTLNTA